MMFSGQAQEFKNSNGIKEVILASGEHAMLPYLKINQSAYTLIDDVLFKQSVGGQSIKERTEVNLKYDKEFIEIKFECFDNPRTEQNSYTKDNSAMYNQEVFEVFISPGEKVPETYLEIEINPNNALFLGRISNKNKIFNNEYVDIKASGITHKVEQDLEKNSWAGYLKIPWKLIINKESKESIYRVNFYRIISNKDHDDSNWKVDENNATFGCWSSTMADHPKFHVPERFGFLVLD